MKIGCTLGIDIGLVVGLRVVSAVMLAKGLGLVMGLRVGSAVILAKGPDIRVGRKVGGKAGLMVRLEVSDFCVGLDVGLVVG